MTRPKPSELDAAPFPRAALITVGVACVGLAVVLWWLRTIPCGWGWVPDSGSRACSAASVLAIQLFSIPAVLIGAFLASWLRVWWPFFFGAAITFGFVALSWTNAVS